MLTRTVTALASFTDPAAEAEYRERHAAADRLAARACVTVAVVGVVVFVPSDLALFGTGVQFGLLLVARAVTVLGCGAVLFQLRRPLTPRVFDRTLFLWGALVATGALFVSSTRPPTYLGHALVNLGTVLLTYTVVPLPLALQLALAGALSLGCVALAAGDGLGATAVLWPFVGANVLGAAVSLRLQHQGRDTFAAQRALESALAEVRTLRGVVRVCAWCKRVAAGEGWQQLEAFVRDHTHAEFTHGICPVCTANNEKSD